jgi:hypothetical protein
MNYAFQQGQRPAMTDITDVLAKIAADLAWRGPGGRPLGNIVLTRAEAETILAAFGGLQTGTDPAKLAGSAKPRSADRHLEPNRDRHSAGYMREYMRRRRAEKDKTCLTS